MREDERAERELERAGDKLLRANHALGHEAGCYTTQQLQRQDRRHTEYLQRHAEICTDDYCRCQAERMLHGMMWRSIARSLREMNCPPRARRCLQLWLMGKYTYREIGAMPGIGVSYQTVGQDVQRALACLRADGMLGLVEVLIEAFGRRQVVAVLDIGRV